ncbi:MAG: hypothetical protein ACOCUD_04185, partial [Bacillota bacterium]
MDNNKTFWYITGLLILFMILLINTFIPNYQNLEMILALGDNASNQNITDVNYMYADYFVGDGSMLTNLSVNTTGNVTPAGSDQQIQYNNNNE